MKSLERINQFGRHIKEKILIPAKNHKGYYIATLCKNGKQKTFIVNRLVGFMFIPNPDKKPEINHKNGNKLDNSVSNLEWNTRSENIKHSWDNGLQTVSEKIVRPIIQYDKQGNFIKEWESAAEVERQLKISNGNISSCCSGKRKTAGSYIWKYKEEE